MARTTTTYTITNEGMRLCDGCLQGNLYKRRVCRGCGKRFTKRPKKPKRSLEDEIAGAEELLKKWSTALTLAVHKLRYYQKRVTVLQRRQLAEARQRPAAATRAIRLRDSIIDTTAR